MSAAEAAPDAATTAIAASSVLRKKTTAFSVFDWYRMSGPAMARGRSRRSVALIKGLRDSRMTVVCRLDDRAAGQRMPDSQCPAASAPQRVTGALPAAGRIL